VTRSRKKTRRRAAAARGGAYHEARPADGRATGVGRLPLADRGHSRHDPPVQADRSPREPRRLDPAERRRSPRVEISMVCTLQRRMGSPIEARTLDLGPGGMRVASDRPLTVDEELDFDILRGSLRLTGYARVMRQHERRVYALRFERLPGLSREALRALMAERPAD
jgi:hypothetical protein